MKIDVWSLLYLNKIFFQHLKNSNIMGLKSKTIAPFIADAPTAQGAYDEIAQE